MPITPEQVFQTVQVPGLSPELRQAALFLAHELGEADSRVLAQLEAIVSLWGLQYASAYLEKARKIHSTTGMPRMDGKGARTLGGIFFFLVRCDRVSVRDPGAATVFPGALDRVRARLIAKALTAFVHTPRPEHRRIPKPKKKKPHELLVKPDVARDAPAPLEPSAPGTAVAQKPVLAERVPALTATSTSSKVSEALAGATATPRRRVLDVPVPTHRPSARR